MSAVVSRVAKGRVPMLPPLTGRSVQPAITDNALLVSILLLACFGVVMIASASMAFAQVTYENPFHFLIRQLVFLTVGCVAGVMTFRIPLAAWEKYGPWLIIASLIGLVAVLIPGIGKEVNGSRRWIDLHFFTVQISETVKLFVVVYMAGYLVRRGHLVQTTFGGFIRPLALICFAAMLLMLEPDFGASVVIVSTAVIMLLVAGVRFIQFVAIVAGLSLVGVILILTSPYRLERVLNFRAPFDDPFDSGYQLSHSLIAIGNGGFSGVGFGNSIQKLMYLPEAHTDFLFAVLCEELGLIGAVGMILLFSFIVWRCFRLARIADEQGNRFAGFLALGIGSWIGLQAFINMGVNLGILPTKGITLPFMSYGGSSAIVFAITFSLLLRVELELRNNVQLTLRARESQVNGGAS